MKKYPDQHSFGVFKPIGHIVVSFPNAGQADAARRALREARLVDDDALRRLSAKEVLAQADADIAKASPLASIGQDLNLVKAQRDMARLGYHFLVIKANDDQHAARIAELARRHGAERAQHFGTMIVEELIAHRTDGPQVAESPDRGLDAQTPSGKEAERAVLRRGRSGSNR